MTGPERTDAAGASPLSDSSLWQLAALVSALDARDLERALTFVADDVRLTVDGMGGAVVGKAAVAERVRALLDRTSDSRFQVHFSAEGQHRARQEITVAAQRVSPDAQGWIVARGTATWEVEPATGLVTLAHVAVDRDALIAQWERDAPLPAGSFRSELALASFDPDEIVHTRVTVLVDPPPRRRRRAGAIAAVAAVLAAGAVTVGLLFGEELGLPAVLADDAAQVGVEESAETAGVPSPAPASAPAPAPSEPVATPSPTPTAVEPTTAPSVAPSQEPGLTSGEGVEVVEEDDGTQVVSLSDQVLFFDPGSATLSGEAGAVLGGVADRLVGAEGELVVVGHTDDIGTPENNAQLSAARAEAVAEVIASRLGPGPVTIVTSARGAQEPVDSNDTAEGRAANRRVELRFTPAP